MSDDLYNDLLSALGEQTPPEAKVTVMNRGQHRFTITHHKPLQETYTGDDIAGFIGFILSVMASGAINTSTTLVAMYHQPEFLLSKLREYVEQSEGIEHEVTPAAQDLAENMIASMAESIKSVLGVYLDEAQGDMRDPVDLTMGAAAIGAAFLMGRFAAVNVHQADEAQANGFAMSLVRMVRELYSKTGLIEDFMVDDIKKMFLDMFTNTDLFRDVETGVIDPDSVQEAMAKYVGQIPRPKGLG